MWVVLALIGLLLIVDLLLLIWFPGPDNSAGPGRASEPIVTIIVALRNEKENLDRLLESLIALDYPFSKLQILFGNDRSTDGTEIELAKLLKPWDHMIQIAIYHDLPGMVGKANVVAQLIPLAKSEFIFITDADVKVPPTWVRTMLGDLGSGNGVIGAGTVVKQEGFFSALQNMDWLLAQSMLKVSSRFYGTLAVSGTNMMITRSACRAIGGYHQIPYALTEDIGFLTAARKNGYSGSNVWRRGALAEVLPQQGLGKLILQRVRWIYGAMKLPWLTVAYLILRSLFLPLIVILGLVNWWLALLLTTIHEVLQWRLVSRMARSWGQRLGLLTTICFDFYYGFVTLAALIYYFLGLKIPWKGRSFR